MNSRAWMMPPTCGRTSAISYGAVRPGSSVVSVTGCGSIVTTPTVGGGRSLDGVAAAGGEQQARERYGPAKATRARKPAAPRRD